MNKDLPPFKQIRKFYLRDQEFEKTTTQKVKRYLVNTGRRRGDSQCAGRGEGR